MALTKQTETHTWYTTDTALWRTADGKIVEDGDPEAAFLFAAAGSQVSADDAERYGLAGKQKPPNEPEPGTTTEPDSELKAGEWVALVEAVESTDELEALTARYEASGADFKTAATAFEKKTDALTAG